MTQSDQRKTERQLGFEAGIEAAAKCAEELDSGANPEWDGAMHYAASEIRALGADGSKENLNG